MSDIRLGVIAGKMKKMTVQKNISPLWKGPILLDNLVTVPNCWVKLMTLPELVLECFGHLIAKEVGLPFLEPIITKDPKNLLKGTRLAYYFATADCSFCSLRQLISEIPTIEHAYLSVLQAWPEATLLAILDELLANADRHHGNLLFDGHAKWIPIDYARALGKPKAPWKGERISSDYSADNLLFNYLDCVDIKNAEKALKQIEAININEHLAIHFNGFPFPEGVDLSKFLISWTFERRAKHLRSLVGKKRSKKNDINQKVLP